MTLTWCHCSVCQHLGNRSLFPSSLAFILRPKYDWHDESRFRPWAWPSSASMPGAHEEFVQTHEALCTQELLAPLMKRIKNYYIYIKNATKYFVMPVLERITAMNLLLYLTRYEALCPFLCAAHFTLLYTVRFVQVDFHLQTHLPIPS